MWWYKAGTRYRGRGGGGEGMNPTMQNACWEEEPEPVCLSCPKHQTRAHNKRQAGSHRHRQRAGGQPSLLKTRTWGREKQAGRTKITTATPNNNNNNKQPPPPNTMHGQMARKAQYIRITTGANLVIKAAGRGRNHRFAWEQEKLIGLVEEHARAVTVVGRWEGVWLG